MYLMCKLIFVQVKITHTIFVFLFKKKPLNLGVYKYSWKKSLYFIAKLVLSVEFAPYSLTRKRTVSFSGALGPWTFALGN